MVDGVGRHGDDGTVRSERTVEQRLADGERGGPRVLEGDGTPPAARVALDEKRRVWPLARPTGEHLAEVGRRVPERCPRAQHGASRPPDVPLRCPAWRTAARSRAAARGWSGRSRAVRSPHLRRGLHDEAELGDLVVVGEARCPRRWRRSRIAATGTAARAGRTGAASSMRRFSVSLSSSCGALGGDQPEHDLLALRHEPQRLEAAGTGVVELEEEAVDLQAR